MVGPAPASDPGADTATGGHGLGMLGLAVLGVLGALARSDADAHEEALRLVLGAMPSLRSLTLRVAGAAAVVVTDRSSPGAGPTDSTLDLPLGRSGKWSGVLCAVSTAPFTPEQARLLRAVADAFALEAGSRPGSSAAAQAILDAEADLAGVAAELEETVAESIVALRHTDPAHVREAATAALAEVRGVARALRAQALGDGLRAALSALHARGASVHADDPLLDAVPPAQAVLLERVAEATCRAAVGSVQITAYVDAKAVKLRVESADNEIDASEVERWRRRASALHGELRRWTGGVELSLPAPTGTEGRHDHGPDL